MKGVKSLLYVPILHTQKEAGEIFAALKIPGFFEASVLAVREQEMAVAEMWRGIYEKIEECRLNFPAVRVYQDVLPVCGEEHKIVAKLSAQGSKNHQLLLRLVERGAKLEGTEDANLLLKEYDYLRQLLEKAALSMQDYRLALKEYKSKSEQLMQQRDTFIARRIIDTLRVEETALIFMGVRHQLEKLLQQDYVVNYIIYRLPFRKVKDIYTA